MSAELEQPMGNAELRVTLAGIESEVNDVKDIALETRDQARKTNGRVSWLEKCMWLALGALPLLTFWAMWLTYAQLTAPQMLTQPQIQSALREVLQQELTK